MSGRKKHTPNNIFSEKGRPGLVELCAIAYVKSDVILQLTTTGGPNY